MKKGGETDSEGVWSGGKAKAQGPRSGAGFCLRRSEKDRTPWPFRGVTTAWFRARFTAHDIYEITGEALERRGFRLLLADLDNTLVPYGVPLPDERLRAWRDDLAAHGVTLFVLSNNRHESRPRIFSDALGIPYIGHAGKPKTPSFVKAMEQMGVTRAIRGGICATPPSGPSGGCPGKEKGYERNIRPRRERGQFSL